jgi:hypothetical protein
MVGQPRLALDTTLWDSISRLLHSESGIHFALLVLVVFNVTFNNISVISRGSIALVEETGKPGENHRSIASHWHTLSHNGVPGAPRHKRDSNSQL